MNSARGKDHPVDILVVEDSRADAELLKRLGAIYSELEVAVVAKELSKTRQAIAEGRADESLAREIHARFTTGLSSVCSQKAWCRMDCFSSPRESSFCW